MKRVENYIVRLLDSPDLIGVTRRIIDHHEKKTLQTSEALFLFSFNHYLLYGVGTDINRKIAGKNIASEYLLCEKLLQLESTKAACFAYRLGLCHGACVKAESPLKYNMRFVEAFSAVKIKPWPFKGPIVIEEKNEQLGETQFFYIDKWCYLGSIMIDTKGSVKKTLEDTIVFDTDLYKILRSYLYTPKYAKNIRTITDMNSHEMLELASDAL